MRENYLDEQLPGKMGAKNLDEQLPVTKKDIIKDNLNKQLPVTKKDIIKEIVIFILIVIIVDNLLKICLG